MTDIDREQLEGVLTSRRIVELELQPIKGKFDVAHLKEINSHIFQDLPKAGFHDVTPGEFRGTPPDGKDWTKNRALSTVDGVFYVAYSRMDDDALKRLDKALEGAKPDQLRDLKTDEFTARLGKIYAELDYVHPFSDGNSRTLRTFTKQLANEAGFELDWARFSKNDTGRDLLYIARDITVNQLAKPHIQTESTMRRIVHTIDRVAGNRDLPDLLRDAVRPSRAVAFERFAEKDALKVHPELAGAYETLREANKLVEKKYPYSAEAQKTGNEAARAHIQTALNKGEKSDFFSHNREVENQKQERVRAPGLDR